MFKRVIQQDPLQIVSIDQAKAQLNIIDDESEDEYLQSLIDGATNLAERYTNRMLSSGTVEMSVGKGTYFIPLGTAESIASAKLVMNRLIIHLTPYLNALQFTMMLSLKALLLHLM